MKRRITKGNLAYAGITLAITIWLLIAMVGSVQAQEAVMFTHPVADTFVVYSVPDANYGWWNTNWILHSSFGFPENRHTYLKYEIPENLMGGKYEISDVRLSIVIDNVSIFNGDAAFADIEVFVTSSEWTEATLTWNNKPDNIGEKIGEFANLTENLQKYQKLSITLDNVVTDAGYLSFILKPGTNENYNAWISLLSRESGAFGTIEFVYTRVYILPPQLIAIALLVTLGFAGFGVYRKLGDIHDLDSLVEGWSFLLYLSILVIVAVVLAWSFIG